MGKIMVVGTAERKFEADRCKVSFEIETRAKSAAEASKLSSEECERLLTELEKLGIEIRSVVVSSDRIVRRGGYGSEEIAYESEKILSVPFPVNPAFVNEVRSLIEKGFSNVAFSAVYSTSNENLLRKELLADAVANSRSKAEILAESMKQTIAGIESANLSGRDDVYDVSNDVEEYLVCEQPLTMSAPDRLADKLKPDTVELSAEVKIVWLVK